MTQPRLIPLEQFFDNPERALAKPSPDGTMLSWLAPLDGLHFPAPGYATQGELHEIPALRQRLERGEPSGPLQLKALHANRTDLRRLHRTTHHQGGPLDT